MTSSAGINGWTGLVQSVPGYILFDDYILGTVSISLPGTNLIVIVSGVGQHLKIPSYDSQ